MYIDYVTIDPCVQNRGYGKRVIKMFMDIYPSMACDCVYRLVPYYTKLGFKPYKDDLSFITVKTKLMTTTFKNASKIFNVLMKRLCKCVYTVRYHDLETDIRIMNFDKENP